LATSAEFIILVENFAKFSSLHIGVAVAPGKMLVTEILYFLTSSLSTFEKAKSPALLAA